MRRWTLLACFPTFLALGPELHAQGVIHTFYGASLGGPNWEGFPTTLQPDLTSSGQGEELDVRLPIYIHYKTDAVGNVTALNPPQPITTQPWWPNFYQLYVNEPVSVGESHSQHDPTVNVEWHPCPNVPLLDIAGGDYELHSNGELSVSIAKSGGIGSTTILRVVSTTLQSLEACGVQQILVFGWNHPGTHTDFQAIPIDAVPGDVVVSDLDVKLACVPNSFPARIPMLTVHWTSTDVAGASLRAVDSGDVAAFSAHYENPPVAIRWGFESDTWIGPGGQAVTGQDARNYHVNFANAPGSSALVLDDDDLFHLCADLTKVCGSGGGGGGGGNEISSSTGNDEMADILGWFGIGSTGETLSLPSGETILRYTVMDWDKFRAARLDPFGYLNNGTAAAAADKVRWEFVKQLYR